MVSKILTRYSKKNNISNGVIILVTKKNLLDQYIPEIFGSFDFVGLIVLVHIFGMCR